MKRRQPMWRRYARFWGANPSADVDDELRFHVEAATDDLIARGVPPVEARRQAEARFGNRQAYSEKCRTAAQATLRRQTRMEALGNWWADLHYALRMLWQSPGFSAAAICTIALGLGAVSTIFALVNGVLLKPYAFPHEDRIVEVRDLLINRGEKPAGLTPARWNMLASLASAPSSAARSLSAPSPSAVAALPAAIFSENLTLSGVDVPVRLRISEVTAPFMPLFGVTTHLGRLWETSSDQPGAEPVVVLSDHIWRSQFAADTAILGRKVILGGSQATVIGVMDRRMEQLGWKADAWTPLIFFPGLLRDRGSHFVTAFCRLNPGVSLSDFNALLARHSAELATQFPDSDRVWKMIAVPLPQSSLGVGNSGQTLTVLLAAVSLLLLLACVNVANLCLVRAESRRHEMAIRRALGASRWRIARPLFLEDLVIAFTGGALGLAFAAAALHALKLRWPAVLPRLHAVQLNLTVALVCAALAFLCALAFALIPNWRGIKDDPNADLKSGGRSASARAIGRGLVVAEVAIAIVLLVGAGLLGRTLFSLLSVNTGFKTVNVYAMDVSYPWSTDSRIYSRFFLDLASEAARTPGIEAFGMANSLPLEGATAPLQLVLEDAPSKSAETIVTANRIVGGDYFGVFGIPLVSGRAFDQRDSQPDHPPVIIVNRAFAQKYLAGANPIGRRVHAKDNVKNVSEIVGVVADARDASLDSPPQPEIFYPYANGGNTWPDMSIALRSSQSPEATLALMRQLVRNRDSNQAVHAFMPIQTAVDLAVARPKLNSLLVGVFAATAVLLAAIGLFGLIAYTVHERTREFAIRLVLGAAPRFLFEKVLSQSLRLVALGLVIGLAASLWFVRLLRSLLYGVEAFDAYTFIGAALLLLLVGILAAVLPARRILAIHPASTLRSQ